MLLLTGAVPIVGVAEGVASCAISGSVSTCVVAAIDAATPGRIPSVRIVPNRGFGSADEAFDAISDFRSTRTITDAQGGTGTVYITEINGQRYVGVNSTNFTDADRALSKKWEAELGIPAGPAGNFQRQTLYHAEANTLMKIYNDTGGQMPSNVTIYVDRIACSSCQNNLPNLVDAMGVQNLTIKLPDGRSALVTKDGFVGDWQ